VDLDAHDNGQDADHDGESAPAQDDRDAKPATLTPTLPPPHPATSAEHGRPVADRSGPC
jgi:hypothetical protein